MKNIFKKLKEKINDKNNINTELTFKILTLGESDVGKTALIRSFIKEKFIKNHLVKIGIDYHSKNIIIDDKKIKLNIWDTAGQERFRNITPEYYQGADGLALIFDISNGSSFEKIIDWLEQIVSFSNKDEIGLILIGNKINLEKKREIDKKRGEKVAEKFGIKYFETSPLTGEGINEAFEYLAKLILEMKKFSLCSKDDKNKLKNSY